MSTVGGNNNILLGTSAQLPNPASSNQIVLGTANSSLLIQGSLNYRVGTDITITKVLDTTPAQFYKILPSAPITITLPAANLNIGVTIIFRRTNANMSLVTFDASSGNVYPFNGISSPVTLGITQYQTQFVCDGSTWYQIYAA